MNKISMMVVFALLLCSLVTAGSINDLDYKDRPCVFCGDQNRVINDGNVKVDADTVGGTDVVGIINSNQAQWSKDDVGGSGMSTDGLSRWLTGKRGLFDIYDNFVLYLETLFVTKAELEQAHIRMDYIEAKMKLGSDAEYLPVELEVAKLRAKRHNREFVVQDYVCNTDSCIKVFHKN
jgi:hypothetical protein